LRVAKGKGKRVILVSVLLVIVTSGVLYLDFKTNQIMKQNSGEIVEVLTPQDIERPEKALAQEVTNEPAGFIVQAEGSNISDYDSNLSSGQDISPASPTQKPALETSSSKGDSAENNTVNIATEDATLIEKAKAYKLASSKLSVKEINALIQWSQGGFTETEKESAKSLFYSRFTEEEQQWILGLFKKYN